MAGEDKEPVQAKTRIATNDAKLPFSPMFSYGNHGAETDHLAMFLQATKDGTFVDSMRLVDGLFAKGYGFSTEISSALLAAFAQHVQAEANKGTTRSATGFPRQNAPNRAACFFWILDRMDQASWRPDDPFLEEGIKLAIKVGDTRTAYSVAMMLRVRQKGQAMTHVNRILTASAFNGDSATAVQILEDFSNGGFAINSSQFKSGLEACLGNGTFSGNERYRAVVPRRSALPASCRILEIMYDQHSSALAKPGKQSDVRTNVVLSAVVKIFLSLADRHHYQPSISRAIRRFFRNVLIPDMQRQRSQRVSGQAFPLAVHVAVKAHDLDLAQAMWAKAAELLGGAGQDKALLRTCYKATFSAMASARSKGGMTAANAMLSPAGLEDDVPLHCSMVPEACEAGELAVAEAMVASMRRVLDKLPELHGQGDVLDRAAKYIEDAKERKRTQD